MAGGQIWRFLSFCLSGHCHSLFIWTCTCAPLKGKKGDNIYRTSFLQLCGDSFHTQDSGSQERTGPHSQTKSTLRFHVSLGYSHQHSWVYVCCHSWSLRWTLWQILYMCAVEEVDANLNYFIADNFQGGMTRESQQQLWLTFQPFKTFLRLTELARHDSATTSVKNPPSMERVRGDPTVDEIIAVFIALLSFTSRSAPGVKALFHVTQHLTEAEHPPWDPEVASWLGGGNQTQFCPPTQFSESSK